MEETIGYMPVKRSAIEELKWIDMQRQVKEIIEQMGEKYILAKQVEKHE